MERVYERTSLLLFVMFLALYFSDVGMLVGISGLCH
jgi:hypothetical protein